MFRLSLPPLLSVRVVAGAVLGLALPEAHPDVALELDRVAVRELEGVEYCCEVSVDAVVLPLGDVGVGGAPVVVRHRVERLVVCVERTSEGGREVADEWKKRL